MNAPAQQSVRYLPVGMYGAVMGLAGLGLACRSAEPVLGVPGWFSDLWVALGALALAILVPAYAAKLLRHPGAVREEFHHPAQLGFCAALPIGLTLVAGGIAPYAHAAAEALWWLGLAMLFCFQVWALRRWLAGGIDLRDVNTGWMIMLIGGIVVPGPGVLLGHLEASRVIFGVSTAATPLVMGLVFYRTVVGPPLPEGLRPTLFIFLVPPSLIFADGVVLWGEPAGIWNSAFYGALVLAPALLLLARGFLRWPFNATWWAFTFPLDALASAALRYAAVHAAPAWRAIAALTLALAVFFVVIVLAKTLLACRRGELLAVPRAI